MNVSVIIANPTPTSFSHAMVHAALNVVRTKKHRVFVHDLYEEKFHPVLESAEADNYHSSDALVERHCQEISAADVILIFHPNWWGQPPAILKGWIDRVLRPGVAYDYRMGDSPADAPVGLLKADCALVFNTSNTPWEREVEVFGNPLQILWKNCVFDLCGVPTFERRVFGPMTSSTAEMRQGWLSEVAALVGDHS